MSSLGFQTLYRILNTDGPGAHRAFLPDAWEPMALPWPQPRQPLLSYEALRPISDYPILGLSVAYELEIAGVIRLLEGSGIPVLARDRGPRDPIVIAGGPITTTNASVLLPFVDVLIAGEAEELLPRAVARVQAHGRRDAALADLAALPHTILGIVEAGHVPRPLPDPAKVARELLPAYSQILTPHTELHDMFLVEPERGCSRRCTFCVMRGSSVNGGMRIVDEDVPVALIPEHARRVGLVGAAVTDLPHLEQLVRSIVDTGRGIGISSLRADRLTPELLRLLQQGGYRSITVASDGISERMRKALDRKIATSALRDAARLSAAAGFRKLKVYQMIGAPGETDADVDELIEFAHELASHIRLTFTFSVFVAKRNTPLDGAPFLGVKQAEARLQQIKRGLRGQVEIRPQSPRTAHVEYLLSRHGIDAGARALTAVHAGGRYADWVQAFADAEDDRPRQYGDEAAWARRKGLAAQRRALPVVA
jgi:radical SAM superfamily enzyme YgiQ (UPF0313 family)